MTEQSCELPLSNADEREIDEILSSARNIAVVGLSEKPGRESHTVTRYLQANGYRIIPVNPAATEVLGERSYPDLASIPPEIAIDVVEIFRRPEFIPEVVDAAIARGARVVWMQLGIVHNEAAGKARAAGLRVVMDRCMKIEHTRWAGERRGGRL